MKRKLRIALILVPAAAAALGAYVLVSLASAGAFRQVRTEPRGPCTSVEGFEGAEDIVVDEEAQRAYVSSADFRALGRGREGAGFVSAYDLAGERGANRLEHDLEGPFHPHGIDLLRTAEGARRLFVVNHRSVTDSAIEIFEVEGDRLRHVRTVEEPQIPSPNDVAAVAAESFYVTNDGGTRPGSPWRSIETFLRLPWADVVYFDGSRAERAARGLTYANGIAVSPSGDQVFVAQTTARTLSVYDRDPLTGRLSPSREVSLETGPDNISVARDGSLWIGAHPNMIAFLRHAADPHALSPSQVLRVEADPGGSTVDIVLQDDGSALSGSSVGAPVGDGARFLVGSVFEGHLLDCSASR